MRKHTKNRAAVKFIAFFLAAAVSASLLTSCIRARAAQELSAGITGREVGQTTLTEEFRKAYLDFCFRLAAASVTEGECDMLSPLSVYTAYSMASNGAKNRTLEQFEEVFGFKAEELNAYVSSLVNALPSSEKARLLTANSIWVSDSGNFKVNEDFLQTNADYYRAQIYSCDFTEPSVVNEINGWTRAQTEGMIKRIIDETDPNTVMILLNAVMFDAEWETKYESDKVSSGKFTNYDGSVSNVKYMSSVESSYISTENAKGFKKSYKDGYYFMALKPDEGTDVYKLLSSLDGEGYKKLLGSVSGDRVTAVIPQFEYDSEYDLMPIMKKLGLTDAFSETEADFTGLGEAGGNIYIGNSLHKTRIEVDTRGTKAAAVTIIDFRAKSAMEPINTVKLDSPFLYFIVDAETDLPLFVGIAADLS